MRLTFIISAILGAALAFSIFGLVLVNELARSPLLKSPSWARKRVAWCLLILCETIALFDRIYHETPGRWTGLAYTGIFMLAIIGFTDSYRLMLKDMSAIPERFRQLIDKEG